MKFDPAHYHFDQTPNRLVFLPWAGFLAFGAFWGYEVPSAKIQQILTRQLRWYNLSTLILFTITLPFGIWLHQVWPCFAASCIVPMVIYSICIYQSTKTLPRIPMSDSVAIFLKKTGASRVGQMVIFGFLCVVFAAWFPSDSPEMIVLLFVSTANSSIAAYILWSA
jgi:hypothetical protein